MSVDESEAHVADEPLKVSASDSETEATQTHENSDGDSGQEGPSDQGKNASDTTYTERLSCTVRTGRGRLRDLDDHASWRDVYRACDVVGWRP